MIEDHTDGCPDSCISDGDEPWDCGCYSHNPPDAMHHEKNPAYRGMTHSEVVAQVKAEEKLNPTFIRFASLQVQKVRTS